MRNTILVAAAFAVALSACGKSSDEAAEVSVSTPAVNSTGEITSSGAVADQATDTDVLNTTIEQASGADAVESIVTSDASDTESAFLTEEEVKSIEELVVNSEG